MAEEYDTEYLQRSTEGQHNAVRMGGDGGREFSGSCKGEQQETRKGQVTYDKRDQKDVETVGTKLPRLRHESDIRYERMKKPK